MIDLPPPVALATAASAQPVQAVIERKGDTVRLQVIGRSARTLAIRYRLTAIDGGNVAVQSGAATLKAGEQAILLDLSQSASNSWHGTLEVFLEGTFAYRTAFPAS